jgi:hypothetical protein
MPVPYRDLCRHAALADVSVACMKKVLDGGPIINRSRARARAYLDRCRLTHLIAVPTTEALLADLNARKT